MGQCQDRDQRNQSSEFHFSPPLHWSSVPLCVALAVSAENPSPPKASDGTPGKARRKPALTTDSRWRCIGATPSSKTPSRGSNLQALPLLCSQSIPGTKRRLADMSLKISVRGFLQKTENRSGCFEKACRIVMSLANHSGENVPRMVAKPPPWVECPASE